MQTFLSAHPGIWDCPGRPGIQASLQDALRGVCPDKSISTEQGADRSLRLRMQRFCSFPNFERLSQNDIAHPDLRFYTHRVFRRRRFQSTLKTSVVDVLEHSGAERRAEFVSTKERGADIPVCTWRLARCRQDNTHPAENNRQHNSSTFPVRARQSFRVAPSLSVNTTRRQ